MKDAVVAWLFGDDTGLSSKAIVAFMEDQPSGRFGYDHPRDPADLGRCIRLLAIAPHYARRLEDMKAASPEWAALIEHWDELVALHNEEAPSGRAPKCYDRMAELLHPIYEKRMAEQRARWEAERNMKNS